MTSTAEANVTRGMSENVRKLGGRHICMEPRQLVSNPGPLTPADNALTRWLDTSRADKLMQKKAVMLF